MSVFRIGGQDVELDRNGVEAAMRGKTPEQVRTHAVEVNSQYWPPKQVLAEATGLDRLDFTTQVARRILQRLGFRTFRPS